MLRKRLKKSPRARQDQTGPLHSASRIKKEKKQEAPSPVLPQMLFCAKRKEIKKKRNNSRWKLRDKMNATDDAFYHSSR